MPSKKPDEPVTSTSITEDLDELDKILEKANKPSGDLPFDASVPDPQAPVIGSAPHIELPADVKADAGLDKTPSAAKADATPELPKLPNGYREHINYQESTGLWAAGYTPRGQTDAEYLGDQFETFDDAQRAVRTDAKNHAAF